MDPLRNIGGKKPIPAGYLVLGLVTGITLSVTLIYLGLRIGNGLMTWALIARSGGPRER